jgi:hypothetical protein
VWTFVRANTYNNAMESNHELKQLYEQDQLQRTHIREKLKGTDFADECLNVFESDVKRAIAVKYFLTTGRLNTDEDFYNAAVLLLHNEVCIEELALAIVLAQLSKDKGHKHGEWILDVARKRFMSVCFHEAEA